MYFSFQLLYSSTLWLFFIFSLCWKLLVTSQSVHPFFSWVLGSSLWSSLGTVSRVDFSISTPILNCCFLFLRDFILLLRLEHIPFLSVVGYISWPWRSVPAVHSPLITQGQGPAIPRAGSDLSLQTQFCRLQNHSFVSGACPLVGGAGSGGRSWVWWAGLCQGGCELRKPWGSLSAWLETSQHWCLRAVGWGQALVLMTQARCLPSMSIHVDDILQYLCHHHQWPHPQGELQLPSPPPTSSGDPSR